MGQVKKANKEKKGMMDAARGSKAYLNKEKDPTTGKQIDSSEKGEYHDAIMKHGTIPAWKRLGRRMRGNKKMEEQFIDRVINILVEMRLNEGLPSLESPRFPVKSGVGPRGSRTATAPRRKTGKLVPKADGMGSTIKPQIKEGIKSGGEPTKRDLQKGRVEARREKGKNPPLSNQQLKASKIARGDIKAPPSKVSANLNKLMLGTAKKGS